MATSRPRAAFFQLRAALGRAEVRAGRVQVALRLRGPGVQQAAALEGLQAPPSRSEEKGLPKRGRGPFFSAVEWLQLLSFFLGWLPH